MIRLNDILDEVSGYHPTADIDLIKKAYAYSAKVHQGQVRKSGEPYLIHPLEVAHILAQLKLDEASIAAGILHDTIEDTLATRDELQGLFGREVADIVDGVTKLGLYTGPKVTQHEGDGPTKPKEVREEEKQAENFRKMLVAMAKDIRVILVKLADRLHNMRTMESMRADKQVRIAQETLDIYAPIANRLGISWLKIELEDLCFRYVKPDDWKILTDLLGKTEKERQKYISDVVKLLEAKLAEIKLTGQISGRMKHLWSIHKKMKAKDTGLESVHDIIAFRVIVPTVGECYQVLGMVHGAFKPVPGRFKDFIAIPKANNYRSLHTTVIGPGGDRIEIQIRTEEMHRIAEEGIAAHWAYKEGKERVYSKDDLQFAWLRALMESQKDLKDPKEFIESVKVDLFQDESFVFTPTGDVKSLPRGSTPIDFAYAIHSKVGDHCVGAKVNGKIVPLRHKLKSGDVVEILTATAAHPNKDWLSHVTTSKAQNRIRSFVRTQEREKSLELGREVVEREFKKYGLGWNKLVKEETELLKAVNHFGYRSIEDAVSAIGIGRLTPSQLIERIAPEKLADPKVAEAAAEVPKGSRLTDIFNKVVTITTLGKGKGGVRISGIDDVLIRFGKCCRPVPGDLIGGFITRGRGVSVHQRNCVKLLEAEPERRIDVTWDVKSDYTRPVSLKVTSDDRAGLLARMTEVLSAKGVSITAANARSLNKTKAVSTFEISIRDASQLKDVMAQMQRIDGVYEVERL